MAKVTTVKPISLGYRQIGSQGNYVPLMGVLKGLSISQDEPDSTEVEAEFYDSPFDIFYEGNPVTMTFELANYDLQDLQPLFGGVFHGAGSGDPDMYDAKANAYTSEWEWRLNFSRGNSALVIYRGLTIGTIKKDADGALNYSVTITAIVYNDGNNDHIYKIVGKPWVNPYPNAVLYLEGVETEITETVVEEEECETITIEGLTESTTITYMDANGETLEASYDDASESWDLGVTGTDRPITIFANGVKWFTIKSSE